jgi:SAM-dependent methyltransferase
MVDNRSHHLGHRRWAPRNGAGGRDDLLRLLDLGHVSPATHPRAIDLGCGTGANMVELASRGFEATGVDLSRVALHRAGVRARRAGVLDRCRFVEADLADPGLPRLLGGPFDLLVDLGTLDDLDADDRAVLARNDARIARPGATLLLWCLYGARAELPLLSLTGPSRMAPGVEPGEEVALFGDAFDITPFGEHRRRTACFLLSRRDPGRLDPRHPAVRPVRGRPTRPRAHRPPRDLSGWLTMIRDLGTFGSARARGGALPWTVPPR